MLSLEASLNRLADSLQVRIRAIRSLPLFLNVSTIAHLALRSRVGGRRSRTAEETLTTSWSPAASTGNETAMRKGSEVCARLVYHVLAPLVS